MKEIGENRIGFKLDDGMFKALQEESDRTMAPVAAIIRKAVEEYLQRTRTERKKR